MDNKAITSEWFLELRNNIIKIFEDIEKDYAEKFDLEPKKFTYNKWEREGGGGGESAIIYGHVFEKAGVNFSKVHGNFPENFKDQIPGAQDNPNFFATGISLVAHMQSPLVPAAHFNTRYIETTKQWFGGGGDLTPTYQDEQDTKIFHEAFKSSCDKYSSSYYNEFKKNCDEYFYLPHRQEHRGVGGIFYDYLNTDNFNNDFNFTKDVGNAFANVYPTIIRNKMFLNWNEEQKQYQLKRRGRYVEFNLLYDRGTKFGLMTGGNTEAILMSLPPVVHWK